MGKREEILKIVSPNIRKILEKLDLSYEGIQEIRIRMNEPLIMIYKGKEYFLLENGTVSQRPELAYCINGKDVKDTLDFISDYSLYAYEDEIRQGYITVQGGHRVGLAGKVLLNDNRIRTVKNISFINIRVSHEKKDCGKWILPYIYDKNEVYHTLIISPPGGGKTTILRDLVRLVSNGCGDYSGRSVGVVDERSEIGACYQGIPQNDIGMRTDILDCCPKAQGMLMLIRSMSPSVIAVDEIGKREDIDAISYVMNCGCQILATVHGASIDDVRTKPVLRKLVEEKMFKRFIVLLGGKNPGIVAQVFDERGSILYDRSVLQ